MEKKWVGLMVSKSLSVDESVVRKEMFSIFGDDLQDLCVVSSEQITMSGDYYLFVSCNNYQDHIDKLKRSRYVVGVVASYDCPYYFSTKEVEDFGGSVAQSKKNGHMFSKGDVVLITNGYLKGLYGIVLEVKRRSKIKVFFSLYVRRFSEVVSSVFLRFVGKMPVKLDGKPVIMGSHVVHNCKLHRSSS